MDLYVEVLNYGIPFFVLLIVIEYLWSLKVNKPVNNALDTVSSLSSGLTNILKDVLGIAVIIVSYEWMYQYIALFNIETHWYTYIITFVLLDFADYWGHRWEHQINILWNRHIIHHSSEEFNLACALRQNISAIVGVFFFLYIPLALIGIDPAVIAIVAPIQLFAQFWYHTQLIDKMGFLEKILVTPSHHRVHHAINDIYLDKNFAAIFIMWDKIFGTFQPELAEVKPVYGVKRQVKTYNPVIINYTHMWLLIKDAWRTNNFIDKLRIWFMPTGWRPEDVIEKYPVESISNPKKQVKYNVEASAFFKFFSAFQMVFHLILMLMLFNNLNKFQYIDSLICAAFLMVSIFAYTSLMDRKIEAIFAEMLKLGLAIFIIIKMNWFAAASEWTYLLYGMIIYLFLSALYTTYTLFFASSKVQWV